MSSWLTGKGNFIILIILLIAVFTFLLLAGCGATYQLTSPDGWSAQVKSYRDIDSADISLDENGKLHIDVKGVNSSRAVEQNNALLMMLLQSIPRPPVVPFIPPSYGSPGGINIPKEPIKGF